MLPTLDKIKPCFHRYRDPSYITLLWTTPNGYVMEVGFFRQWNGMWYRHERE